MLLQACLASVNSVGMGTHAVNHDRTWIRRHACHYPVRMRACARQRRFARVLERDVVVNTL
jgi:hypothetical protein